MGDLFRLQQHSFQGGLVEVCKLQVLHFCPACDEEENVWTNSGQKRKMRTLALQLARLNWHLEGGVKVSEGGDKDSVSILLVKKSVKGVLIYYIHIYWLACCFSEAEDEKIVQRSDAVTPNGFLWQRLIFPMQLSRRETGEHRTDHFSIWTGGKKSRAASGMFSAGEKGFPWHWHWVNKAFCYSFCRTALVGGVHIHWGVYLQDLGLPDSKLWRVFCSTFCIMVWRGSFSEIFVFWLQQLLLHFHPQFAMVQLFNRWIASNSFFAFNSHSLKLNEQRENNICFRRNFLIQENVKWHHSYKSTFYSFTKSRTICFLLIKMIWKIHWFVVFVKLRFLMIRSQSRSLSWEREFFIVILIKI